MRRLQAQHYQANHVTEEEAYKALDFICDNNQYKSPWRGYAKIRYIQKEAIEQKPEEEVQQEEEFSVKLATKFKVRKGR